MEIQMTVKLARQVWRLMNGQILENVTLFEFSCSLKDIQN